MAGGAADKLEVDRLLIRSALGPGLKHQYRPDPRASLTAGADWHRRNRRSHGSSGGQLKILGLMSSNGRARRTSEHGLMVRR